MLGRLAGLGVISLLLGAVSCASGRSSFEAEPQPDSALMETLEAELSRQVAANPISTQDTLILKDVEAQFDGDMVTLTWDYPMIPGDYNRNGFVNSGDLAPLGKYYGAQSTDANWDHAKLADGDGNGVVGMSDLGAIARHWFQRSPSIEGSARSFVVVASDSPDGPWQYMLYSHWAMVNGDEWGQPVTGQLTMKNHYGSTNLKLMVKTMTSVPISDSPLATPTPDGTAIRIEWGTEDYPADVTHTQVFRDSINNLVAEFDSPDGTKYQSWLDTDVAPGELHRYWLVQDNEYGRGIYGVPQESAAFAWKTTELPSDFGIEDGEIASVNGQPAVIINDNYGIDYFARRGDSFDKVNVIPHISNVTDFALDGGDKPSIVYWNGSIQYGKPDGDPLGGAGWNFSQTSDVTWEVFEHQLQLVHAGDRPVISYLRQSNQYSRIFLWAGTAKTSNPGSPADWNEVQQCELRGHPSAYSYALGVADGQPLLAYMSKVANNWTFFGYARPDSLDTAAPWSETEIATYQWANDDMVFDLDTNYWSRIGVQDWDNEFKQTWALDKYTPNDWSPEAQLQTVDPTEAKLGTWLNRRMVAYVADDNHVKIVWPAIAYTIGEYGATTTGYDAIYTVNDFEARRDLLDLVMINGEPWILAKDATTGKAKVVQIIVPEPQLLLDDPPELP